MKGAIVAAMIMMSLASAAVWTLGQYRQEAIRADRLEAKTQQQALAIKGWQAALQKEQEYRRDLEQQTQERAEALTQVADHNRALATRLADLERTDADVSRWADTRIPDGILDTVGVRD
jgi:uncharacterized protein YdbL (DUF1318 family)